MYREGLPAGILVTGLSFGALVVATLIVDPNVLAITLTIIAILIIYFTRRQIKRNSRLLLIIIATWAVCVGVQRFAVPYIFNNVFECYQSQRIYSAVGKDYDCSQNKHNKIESAAPGAKAFKPDDYNVRQSKIAIGSGGFWGRGFLKGTQTRGNMYQSNTLILFSLHLVKRLVLWVAPFSCCFICFCSFALP